MHRRRHVAAPIAFVLTLLTGTAATPAPTEHAPSALKTSNGTLLWVSAEEAFTPSSDLRPDAFSPPVRAQLDELRAMNGDRCIYAAVAPSLEIDAPFRSLENLAIHADTILAGTVTAAKLGFYGEEPGTLFSIRVTTALKRGRTTSSDDTVYLFLPIGEINTPRGMICAKGRPGAVLPAVGHEVLFFAHTVPLDAGKRVFLVEPHRHLIVQSATELSLPVAIRGVTAPTNLTAAIARVRSVIGQSEGSKRAH